MKKIALLLVLVLPLGCTNHLSTFVRSVTWAPSGALLVTTCTLDQEYFTHVVDVDRDSCHVETKPAPVHP